MEERHSQAWAWVQGRLTPSRLEHTRGVVKAATELARRFGADEEKADLAAILHDAAKNLGGPQLLSLAHQEGIIVDIVQQQAPDLLHGPVAAALARRELNERDEDVLRAVAIHTTGAPGMSALDKVIYLADYIEPGRSFPGVDQLREAAAHSLDRAVLLAMDGALRYVVDRGWLIHPLTVEARNWLLGQGKLSGEGGPG
ncbi:MAG: bis(5'-nucleosyl)-tetraphosphatase (symmetrical) YqeK [Bacillota bacterium]